jgi:hypothetical protein
MQKRRIPPHLHCRSTLTSHLNLLLCYGRLPLLLQLLLLLQTLTQLSPPNCPEPHPLILGPNLSIAQFCEQYNLDDDIKERFLQNKFRFTDSFKYIELSELKTLEFMGGEITELKAAIEKWAQGVV